MQVRQIRQPLAVTLSDGRIQNRYQIKLNNKTSKPMEYHLGIQGLENAELQQGRSNDIKLYPEQSGLIYVKVQVDPSGAKTSQQSFLFVLAPVGATEQDFVKQPAVFFIPEDRLEGNK